MKTPRKVHVYCQISYLFLLLTLHFFAIPKIMWGRRVFFISCRLITLEKMNVAVVSLEIPLIYFDKMPNAIKLPHAISKHVNSVNV